MADDAWGQISHAQGVFQTLTVTKDHDFVHGSTVAGVYVDVHGSGYQ